MKKFAVLSSVVLVSLMAAFNFSASADSGESNFVVASVGDHGHVASVGNLSGSTEDGSENSEPVVELVPAQFTLPVVVELPSFAGESFSLSIVDEISGEVVFEHVGVLDAGGRIPVDYIMNAVWDLDIPLENSDQARTLAFDFVVAGQAIEHRWFVDGEYSFYDSSEMPVWILFNTVQFIE